MVYDIASKRLAQIAPAPFLSLLLQTQVDPGTQVEDLPQEMPTVNRADQVWRVTSPGSEPYLVLSEFLTHWAAGKKLDMALYALSLKKRHGLRLVPIILLCLPNQNADDVYLDENCRFKFRLLSRIYSFEVMVTDGKCPVEWVFYEKHPIRKRSPNGDRIH